MKVNKTQIIASLAALSIVHCHKGWTQATEPAEIPVLYQVTIDPNQLPESAPTHTAPVFGCPVKSVAWNHDSTRMAVGIASGGSSQCPSSNSGAIQIFDMNQGTSRYYCTP